MNDNKSKLRYENYAIDETEEFASRSKSDAQLSFSGKNTAKRVSLPQLPEDLNESTHKDNLLASDERRNLDTAHFGQLENSL